MAEMKEEISPSETSARRSIALLGIGPHLGRVDVNCKISSDELLDAALEVLLLGVKIVTNYARNQINESKEMLEDSLSLRTARGSLAIAGLGAKGTGLGILKCVSGCGWRAEEDEEGDAESAALPQNLCPF